MGSCEAHLGHWWYRDGPGQQDSEFPSHTHETKPKVRLSSTAVSIHQQHKNGKQMKRWYV